MWLLEPRKTYCELLATMPYSTVPATNAPSFRLKLSLIQMSYRDRTATCSFELYQSHFRGTVTAFGGEARNLEDLFSDFAVSVNGITLWTAAAIEELSTGDNKMIASGTVTLPYEEDGTLSKLNLVWTAKYLDEYNRRSAKKASSATPVDNPTVFPTADGGKICDLQMEPFFKKVFAWQVGGAGSFYDDGYLMDEAIDENYHLIVPYVPAGAEELRLYFNDFCTITIDNPEEKAYTVRLYFNAEERAKLYKMIPAGYTGNPTYARSLFSIDFLIDGAYETYTYLSPLYVEISLTKPTVSGTVVDTNPVTIALTGDPSILIRNASNALATISAVGNQGATIVETAITNGGSRMVGVESYNFLKAESGTFYFEATDNRGRTGNYAIDAQVIEYIPPTATFKGSVISGDGEMKYRISGNYFDGSFGAVHNEYFVYYRYKLQGAEDTEYTDWVEVTTGVQLDTENNTYSVTGVIEGLDYTQAYVFQAYIADYFHTIRSGEYVAISIPVFDWSATDFNFNVPVTIMGSKVGGANKILWEGDSQMQANDTIQLSEAISAQTSGIVLVFSSTLGSWVTHFVPKIMVDINYGGGQSFFLTVNAGLSYVGAKYLYISDEEITGHVSNVMYNSQNQYPETASGLVAANAMFHLNYVIGV